MANITLHSDALNSATSVSNIFIDEYMSGANGEFVKVYLYLLRLMNLPDAYFSISSIADKFEHTEKDIKRALSYWERMHLLRLEYDANQNLTGICLLDSSCITAENDSGQQSQAPVRQEPVEQKSQKRQYSADDIDGFRRNEAVAELFFIAERYLSRTLSATDVNTILYFYDGLGFSTDLIEYLIEYCVSKGHTSIRYIEKVALAWADGNILTVADAKQAAGMHNQTCFTVMKALGISGRNLIPSETKMIDKWKNDYGFSNELIAEACRRTISATHQPSFEYTDSILTNWHKKQVKSPADIARADAEHESRKKTASASVSVSSKNKFNNFSQRSYDYEQLERMLLTTTHASQEDKLHAFE